MKKCDPNARARCPDGKNCELYAEYADDSWCDTFNEIALKQPMSNADRIRGMSDEELADFLCSLAYAGNTPWSDPFARKFCDNCPTVEGTVQETGKTMSFYECDFADGKCPHGSDVVWWLRQPSEEVP